jgi:hypothetical protein
MLTQRIIRSIAMFVIWAALLWSGNAAIRYYDIKLSAGYVLVAVTALVIGINWLWERR